MAKTAKKSLIGKLSKILGEIEKIEKDGHNDHYNYDYVTEAAVSELLRKKLSENCLFITMEVDESRVNVRQVGGKDKMLTEIKTIHTIHDGETGEKLRLKFQGQGADNGDKGMYKAATGAVKYFLLKQFLVSSGDDPERDEGFNQDRQTVQTPTKATSQKQTPTYSKPPVQKKTVQTPKPPPVAPRYPREHGDTIRSKGQQEQIDQLWGELMVKTSTPQGERVSKLEGILHRDFGTKTTNFLRSKQATILIDNIIAAIEKLPKYPAKEPEKLTAAMGPLVNPSPEDCKPPEVENNDNEAYAEAERKGMMIS